jgi:hypothetical protein
MAVLPAAVHPCLLQATILEAHARKQAEQAEYQAALDAALTERDAEGRALMQVCTDRGGQAGAWLRSSLGLARSHSKQHLLPTPLCGVVGVRARTHAHARRCTTRCTSTSWGRWREGSCRGAWSRCVRACVR